MTCAAPATCILAHLGSGLSPCDAPCAAKILTLRAAQPTRTFARFWAQPSHERLQCRDPGPARFTNQMMISTRLPGPRPPPAVLGLRVCGCSGSLLQGRHRLEIPCPASNQDIWDAVETALGQRRIHFDLLCGTNFMSYSSEAVWWRAEGRLRCAGPRRSSERTRGTSSQGCRQMFSWTSPSR